MFLVAAPLVGGTADLTNLGAGLRNPLKSLISGATKGLLEEQPAYYFASRPRVW